MPHGPFLTVCGEFPAGWHSLGGPKAPAEGLRWRGPQCAVWMALDNRIDALVTAPISKQAIRGGL